MKGYLNEQEFSIASDVLSTNGAVLNSPVYKYFIDEYKKNVEFYNKTFNQNWEEKDFSKNVKQTQNDKKKEKKSTK